ncbi:coatomer protein complex, subunit beta 2 [Cladochytrium replicatum]|nr:coatomer protein complex, subunit beta 2 [Cladochytrium replicatum]
MPLRLEIKRKFSNRSDRVKAVDLHPTEPWMLTTLYNGNAYIWNHETQTLVKSFEICDLPVRAAKFVARKSWFITGSDDNQIRVFNYNTHEKVTTFEAHNDYIRYVAVHPTQPYILTCADDMLIKLWDWEKNWRNIMVFEGHTHFVMQVAFNPKDPNTFASASLDYTVKVWSLGSSTPNYTLQGHEKGVNFVDYYHGGDKPYLVSGADDKQVKVWDYQNKTCVQTLEGHTHNIICVCYHPDLPIIISGGEDGTVRIWHANTYRLENTLNYGMERIWSIAYLRSSNDIAIGYDEGAIVLKLGREEPSVSMDNGGKIIWARHNEIQTANVKATVDDNIKDGERLSLSMKELGSCEVYPQTLQHSPNGRFVVVCGDGEYIIYTALAWRNKSFGSALEHVWANDSNEYAIRESTSKIRLFKNFKEKTNVAIKLNYSADGIYGGVLLGIRSSTFINFYDWETGVCVRRIDIVVRNVYWSETDLVAIACDDIFYVLKFNRMAYEQKLERLGGAVDAEGGIEEAFDVVCEINETVKTGTWVGDCFIYTNSVNRLNYLVGSQVSTISHFDVTMYILGYILRDNRIYLTDKDVNVFSYSLPSSLIEYQTAVLRGDLESAAKILPSVPAEQRNRIARFLDGQGLREEALEVSMDSEHRFDLAIQLGKLNVALMIANDVDREERWKTLGDTALAAWKFDMAEECFVKSKDLQTLLLLYQASGNAEGFKKLAAMAEEKGDNNIAFLAYLVRGDLEKCLDLLVRTERISEAALMARTYMPSQIPKLVIVWQEHLRKINKRKWADAIANPVEHEHLFSDLKYGMIAEDLFKQRREKFAVPATQYSDMKDSLDWDVISAIKQKLAGGDDKSSQDGSESPVLVEPTGDGVSTPQKQHRVAFSGVNGNSLRPDDVCSIMPSPKSSDKRFLADG